MAAEPPILTPTKPKRKLGCLAKLGLGLVVSVLLFVGLMLVGGIYRDHHEARAQVEEATAALLADDPAKAMIALHDASRLRPDDASIAQLYQVAQEKWLKSLDHLIADQTPAQRYLTLGNDIPSMKQLRQALSEPQASTLRNFIERNTAATQVQINETVERAMDFLLADQLAQAEAEMETLRVCYRFPGLRVLWDDFLAAEITRLLIHAGELGQNGQATEAREQLDRLMKNYKITPQEQAEARFRIDLGDFNSHLRQALNAAAKGDRPTAQTRLNEAQPILFRLLASGELQNFYQDLPAKERGSPLIQQLEATQFLIRQIAADQPAR